MVVLFQGLKNRIRFSVALEYSYDIIIRYFASMMVMSYCLKVLIFKVVSISELRLFQMLTPVEVIHFSAKFVGILGILSVLGILGIVTSRI